MGKLSKILCFGYMIYLTTMIPFFFWNGYDLLVTRKYTVFYWGSIVFYIAMIPVYLLSLRKEEMRKPSLTDLFMLIFLGFNIVTYILTGWKDLALKGFDGWYMGLLTFLFMIGTYYFVSRRYDKTPNLMVYLLITSFIIFFWGLLNRFSVYPIRMAGADSGRLGPLGNINWFAGYWSVFFPLGVVAYMTVEGARNRALLAIYSAVAIACGVMNGSDSVFIPLGIVLVILWMMAFRTVGTLKRFMELLIIAMLMCQLMRLIDYSAVGSMAYHNPIMDFLLSGVTLVVLLIAVVARLMLAGETKDEKELLPKFRWLQWLLPIVLAVAIVVVVIMITYNTKHPGSLGRLSSSTFFTFDEHWGTERGADWMAVFQTFPYIPPLRKLFGIGQDCMAMVVYQVPWVQEMLDSLFGEGTVLTNAHNEMLTYLVDIGILGTAAFYCVTISSIVRGIRNRAKSPYLLIFAVSVLSYLLHNTVSFPQILSTPFLFLILGMAEAEQRAVREKAGT